MTDVPKVAGVVERYEASPSCSHAYHIKDAVPYRIEQAPIVVEHPRGGVFRGGVATRSLSPKAVEFLFGGFLHPGTSCLITLRRTDDEAEVSLQGVVRDCEHYAGASYRVWLQFGTPVHVPAFVRDARSRGRAEARDAWEQGPCAAPAVSSKQDQPGVSDLLGWYGERVETMLTQLRAAVDSVDIVGARKLCRVIRVTGESYGYTDLSREAARSEALLDAYPTYDSLLALIRSLERECSRLR